MPTCDTPSQIHNNRDISGFLTVEIPMYEISSKHKNNFMSFGRKGFLGNDHW